MGDALMSAYLRSSRLAYCEIYVTLGTFFRRFPRGLEVYKTTQHDMEYDDFFSSYHIEGRNWFKAIGTKEHRT